MSGPQAMHARVEQDFRNHPPATEEVAAVMDAATEKFLELGHWIVDNVPAGREQSTALTKLEEVSMHSKAGIARHQPGTDYGIVRPETLGASREDTIEERSAGVDPFAPSSRPGDAQVALDLAVTRRELDDTDSTLTRAAAFLYFIRTGLVPDNPQPDYTTQVHTLRDRILEAWKEVEQLIGTGITPENRELLHTAFAERAAQIAIEQ